MSGNRTGVGQKRVHTDWTADGAGPNGRRNRRGYGPRLDASEVSLEEKFSIDVLQMGETRTGYLYNLRQSTVYADEEGEVLSALLLYFVGRDGQTFRGTLAFRPYFLLDVSSEYKNAMDVMVSAVSAKFGVTAEIVEKEDLSLPDHLSGKKNLFVKVTAGSSEALGEAKRTIKNVVDSNRSRMEKTSSKSRDLADPIDHLTNLLEHDLSFINRACIDLSIRCGRWYEVTKTSEAGGLDITYLPELLAKPELRIMAFDIETSKPPLKFPDASIDNVLMISLMVDGQGYLIVNREEVLADIEDFEYTPKPEFEGMFTVLNRANEVETLKCFIELMQSFRVHILTTFNGDNFDLPFIFRRCEFLVVEIEAETGLFLTNSPGGNFFSGKHMVHLDCFAWVQRDSYLPQGSQGLKAVTKAKLKYNPVELDPELITEFAKSNPQELATYSVSDAVATFYLYHKYIHDFIFALSTVIPGGPDDVLRKGSGTLCEWLLMAQAFASNVVFPNKHTEEKIRFVRGRLVEAESYEGGRVECLRTGIFRADVVEKFKIDVQAVQELRACLEETLKFFLVSEEKVADLSQVVNFDQVKAEIDAQLLALISGAPASAAAGSDGAAAAASAHCTLHACPLIYHLDVGAMYPNIILSNRLQPSAIVDENTCNQCSYGRDAEEQRCQRPLKWKWRGDLFMATKADVAQLRRELEAPGKLYKSWTPGTTTAVRKPWKELTQTEQTETLLKNVRELSRKMYKRIKTSVFEERTDVVCQRENPFYINTVRAFRDRRYEFKDQTKQWQKKKGEAEQSGDAEKLAEAKDMCLLYESLQLAHKCILNSFYGYVFRAGSRWHSMTMGGIVTYTGSSLIKEAREFVERVGLTLELDTDGIWCMLPQGFPDKFKFQLQSGKTLAFSYPCTVLNERVHDKYTNDQYQTEIGPGVWETSKENSIFFEIDGPYKAMVLPASTEEGKMLKKRYAVFNFDGSIAELKGFEIKRRGELKLVQVFQEEVFPQFLAGADRAGVYDAVSAVANRWLHVLETKGKSLTDEELIYLISERKSMSKSVEDSGDLKSASITTARRAAEFLGDGSGFLREKGISLHLVIANRPVGSKPTDRAIPVSIFYEKSEAKKKQFLSKWLGEHCLQPHDLDIRAVLDWDYYRTRLGASIHKLVVIPALNQRIKNPCPSLPLPPWLEKKVAEWNDPFKQTDIRKMFGGLSKAPAPANAPKVRNAFLSSDEDDDADADVDEDEPQAASAMDENGGDVENGGVLPVSSLLAPKPQQPLPQPQAMQAVDAVEEARVAMARRAEPPCGPGRLEAVGGRRWVREMRSLWRAKQTAMKKAMGLVRRRASLRMEVDRLYGEIASFARPSAFVSKRLASVPWHVLKVEWPGEARPGASEEVVLRVAVREEASFALHTVRAKTGGTSALELVGRIGAMTQLRTEASADEEFLEQSRLRDPLGQLAECKESYLTGARLATSFVHVAFSGARSRGYAGICGRPGGRGPRQTLVFLGVPAPTRPGTTALERWWLEARVSSSSGAGSAAASGGPAGAQKEEEELAPSFQFAATQKEFWTQVSRAAGECMPGCFVVSSEISDEEVSRSLFAAATGTSGVPVFFRSPAGEEAFPALGDWPRWATQKWASGSGRLAQWWEEQVSLARLTRIPVGNLRPSDGRVQLRPWDVLLSRQLGFRVASDAATDSETSEAGQAEAGQAEAGEGVVVNTPGAYRRFCVSVTFGGTLCGAALSRTRQLLETEGLQLSASDRKFQALVGAVGEVYARGRRAEDAGACSELLESLLGWVCDRGSAHFSGNLRRRVVETMEKFLARLYGVARNGGCEVVFGNFNRCVLATPKQTTEELRVWWRTLARQVEGDAVLASLALKDESVTGLYASLLWLDNANFSGAAIDRETSGLDDKTHHHWKLAEFLAPGVRGAFFVFLSDFVSKPLRRALQEDAPRLLDVLRSETMQKLRRKIFNFVTNNEERRSFELAQLNRLLDEEDEEISRASDADEDEDEDAETKTMRRQHQVELLQSKWQFPAPPGYLPNTRTSNNPTVEFVKTLFFALLLDKTDPTVASALESMKADALRLLNVKPFSKEAEFRSPLISVRAAVVRDFACHTCGEISDIDVLTHTYSGPGLFACAACRFPLNREKLEAALVKAADDVVAKWHAQPVVCERCKRMQYGLCPRFCACSGKFVCRADRDTAKNSLLVLRSVAEPHDFRILLEVTANYLAIL